MKDIVLTTLNEQVKYLFNKIKDDTKIYSFTKEITQHPLFEYLLSLNTEPGYLKEIILNMNVDPFIAFEVLAVHSNENIDNVIPFNHRGYVSKMMNDWYLWAEKNNII
jgi:hypothetical protein